ncbi:hypothetical protein BCR44DRAFT_142764, partial [Catenaria anguillulae PL171]
MNPVSSFALLRRGLPYSSRPTLRQSCLRASKLSLAATRLQLSTSVPALHAAKPPSGPLKNDSLLAHLTSSPRSPPSPIVFFIDEAGKDQGQHDLRTLLSSTDRSTHDLVQVATRPNPTIGLPPIPIVKLISRKAQIDKLKSAAAAKKAAVAPEQTEKEVQVGSKVAQADLKVKGNKARDFLSRGYRVKLTVVHKPGSPRDSKYEVMQLLLDHVNDLVANVVKPAHDVGRNWCTIVVGKK